jgi:hypothetical protein
LGRKALGEGLYIKKYSDVTSLKNTSGTGVFGKDETGPFMDEVHLGVGDFLENEPLNRIFFLKLKIKSNYQVVYKLRKYLKNSVVAVYKFIRLRLFFAFLEMGLSGVRKSKPLTTHCVRGIKNCIGFIHSGFSCTRNRVKLPMSSRYGHF